MTPELEKLVDKEIVRMIKDEPVKMIQFFLSQMGNHCYESNAEEMTISQEQNIDGKRHEVKAVITIKPTHQ
jgi:hypothetical protein